MIKVKNLCKSYSGKEMVIKDVSFEVEKGEIVGLLGPNGAGKTTIMRILTCYMNPTDGEVLIDGHNVIDNPESVKKLVGYLPENTPQYADMTVYEYLYFTGEIRKIDQKEIPSRIDKMISLTSLENVVSKKISQLSKGYKKRVGLASVLIHDPPILILDEPTSGLDPNQIILFRKMLRKLSEKKTVILSTHILSEIEATCERVVIIHNGKVAEDSSMQDLINKFENDNYIDFIIRAENLLKVENELLKVKGAWKVEFEKKEAKDHFHFKAMVNKNSKFEDNLKEFVKSKNWELISYNRGQANLEEIFLKLTSSNKEAS